MASNPERSSPGNLENAARPRGYFRWIAVVAILVIAGIITALILRKHSENEASAGKGSAGAGKAAKGGPGGQQRGPIPVVLGTVAQKDFPIYLDGLGTVQAFNTVTVRSRVEGQLQKLGFKEGEDVHAGQMLAMIDPAPFQTQVEQAEAKKAQDEAQAENARIELKRDESLMASKILAQDVYDTQKALVSQLEAAVKADNAAINSAKVQLAYTTVTAPIDGRTGLRLVDEGNIIRSGDSNGIVVLTQLKPISIIFTLPEQVLGQIQAVQAETPMTILALDRDNKTVLDQGKLSVVDNQIDTSTGTIRLKGAFPNNNLRLWPGQFVNARLLLAVRTNGVVVPASVVQRGPEGAYAFVVNDDMSVRMSPVKVAQVDQGQALIESGLSPGEKIVVDGQFKLQPGSTVKPATNNTSATAQVSTNRPTQKAGDGSGKKKKGQQS